ncbi:AraC family transcriptional regulator [Paenibacillus eucommiae]|uniref:YesN/AraC family two-component response regulator n=1 Tax=Paenibacillus eucommiae TaxID=1355755 RepID=A0ABS4ILQ8_9BACL|nr:AraC family transcriptional regulator [Paenibacillus eucommiae]MBP1988503.1 YesN/AraC family two-component response regulator [Paenibacillus eucommiae]
MDFIPYRLREQLIVNDIYTCFYFELSNRQNFSGESHDFWEMVYMDKGEVNANTESGYYRLHQGNILIHSPNEYHQLESTGNQAPNLFIITFRCDNEAMTFFDEHKLFRIGHVEHAVLTQLMKESLHSFALNMFPINPRQDAPFASEQLFKTYLEQLLILIIRNGRPDKQRAALLSTTKENQNAQLSKQIIAYLEQNLSNKMTLDSLCAQFGISRTQMNILFKRTVGIGIITYVNRSKIEHAKKYIREEIYNLTEISNLLGYSSVHYFSRHFKKMVGMTPSEYTRTIKARITSEST